MRGHIVTAVAAVAVVVFLVGNAPAQDVNATIRTYQGVSYKVTDPTLEVFYTVGEPKETTGQTIPSGFQSATNLPSGMSVSGGGGEQPAAAGGKEEPLLRGHSQMGNLTVSSQGVETRIALDQIRTIRFARMPVSVPGLQLPPYIPYYRYSASVSLMSGEKVEADYVNLGETIIRGLVKGGRVDVPWEGVESIVFER